jgi:hypothetical protein
MSGSHPVASGSIPGIGWVSSLVLLAQLAEHPLNIYGSAGEGSSILPRGLAAPLV